MASSWTTRQKKKKLDFHEHHNSQVDHQIFTKEKKK